MPPSPKGKGKARASRAPSDEPDEYAPLFDTSSRPATIHIRRARSSLRHHLCTALIIFASLLTTILLFVTLLAYSFKPSESEISSLPRTAFRYNPPESFEILEVSEVGVLVNITMKCGIDYDKAVGVASLDGVERAEAESRGDRGLGSAWWESVRKWTAHRVIDLLDARTVQVEIPGLIHVYPHSVDSPPLLSVHLYDMLDIPLIPDMATRGLQRISFMVLAEPIASTGELWEFAQQAWAAGEVNAVVGVRLVLARIPGLPLSGDISAYRLALNVDMPVPSLPGLPFPGHPLNLSDLVHLESYSLSNPSTALTITALANLPNPLQYLFTNASLPFGLPFSISLNDGTQMAKVVTQPLEIGHSSTLHLNISGQVSNLHESTGLSTFLQNYLHGIDNPIRVTGLSKLPSFAENQHHPQLPPSWLLSSLPSLSLDLSFPAPKPPPKIIQEVTIERMRLTESGGKMRASGTVVAIVELPPGLDGMEIEVVQVLPDVLVYDGPSTDEEPDADNPPPRAFGHIRPEEYINSTTILAPLPGRPSRMIVRAPLKDVELDILPGRDKVLSDFVSKVVFKGGAVAGIKGTAGVGVEILGVDGKVSLDGLPVSGEFWVGKQRG